MANEAYAQVLVSLPWDEKMGDIPIADTMSALGLYTAALCFCQDNLTDGRIPRFQLCKLIPAPQAEIERVADLLDTVNLFDSDEKSFFVHNYLKFNRSRSEVEVKKDQCRTAGAAGGRAKAASGIVAERNRNASEPPSEQLAEVYPTAPTTALTAADAEKCSAVYTEDTAASPIQTSRPEPPETPMQSCERLIGKEYGITLNSKLREQVRFLCDSYAAPVPRMEYGIKIAGAKARAKNESPSARLALAIAQEATEQELGKKTRHGPICGVCNDTYMTSEDQPCDYCAAGREFHNAATTQVRRLEAVH